MGYDELERKLTRALDGSSRHLLRYGLVGLLLWFGAFKFTETEARAIEPLLANSPLTSWMLAIAGLRAASALVGAAEIAVATFIALRPVAPTLSAAGSLAAMGVFSTTLSLLVTTPGMFVWVDGFLVPSEAGAFIIKDVFLLGAAATSAEEAIRARSAVTRRD